MHNQNQYPSAGIPPQQTLPATPPVAPKSNRGETAKSILSTVAIFLLAPLIAVLLTAFVFQSYEVDGPSMETTLQNQDRLIVYKLPKTWTRIWGNDYIPNKGDVIVFTRHSSDEFSEEGDRQLIKRVIGVPGDRVVIKGGTVTVFNEENPSGYNPDKGQEYSKSFSKTEGSIDTSVDEGEVYVLGDNRGNSLDSRIFGPIKSEDIGGELVMRIYPFNKFDAF